MSKYVEHTTVINDVECLKRVLKTRFKEVEHHSTPQQLIDYQGRSTKYTNKDGDKAEVIIRRKLVGGASNDIGFVKDPSTGNFKAIISDYDSGRHNQKWLESLAKDYLVEKTKKIMSSEDSQMVGAPETLASGAIRMKFRVGVTG